jgi:hypothetical protein
MQVKTKVLTWKEYENVLVDIITTKTPALAVSNRLEYLKNQILLLSDDDPVLDFCIAILAHAPTTPLVGEPPAEDLTWSQIYEMSSVEERQELVIEILKRLDEHKPGWMHSPKP